MSPRATPALFYLPGADKGSTQWRMSSLQLVNWGGFTSYAAIPFSPNTTLLTGASGSGKSTVLDAYIAVMMRSSVPFNGASNDATLGRARGANQRNLVSYLRGKLDSARDTDTRELTDQVLRGKGHDTWGAIAIAFVNDHGRYYTVARLYYVPKSASRDSDLVRKLCTIEGSIDLREFEPLVEGRFDKRATKTRFPQLTMHDSQEEFILAYCERLGIGANGDGEKALRLLARIQAGQQVHTVDQLYKSMVLERPGTFDAADAALKHFQDLEDAHEAMVTEERKAGVLANIPKHHAAFDSAHTRAQMIDTFGIFREGTDTPFGLWALNTEDALLARAEKANREAEAEARAERADAQTAQAALESRKADVERDLSNNDAHATIQRLEAEAAQARRDADHARRRRHEFDRQTARLCLELGGEGDFAAAQERSRQFLATYEDAHQALQRRRDELLTASYEPSREKSELVDEQKSLATRSGRMDAKLHASRMAIAGATGLDPDQLPFLGELIDVLPEHRRWRKAIETVLFNAARIMLVDVDRLEDVSRAIDPLHLLKRINFQGVDLAAPTSPTNLDPRYVSGKIAYKDSPFTAWVHERITAAGTDAICVEGAEELAGGGRRVTVNGQTRNGRAGAHGELGASFVIGFSPEERLAEITARLNELDAVLDAIEGRRSGLGEEIRQFELTGKAHEYLVRTESWRSIDPDGIDQAIMALDEQRRAILESDDTLRELREENRRLGDALKDAIGKSAIASKRIEELDNEFEAIFARKDQVVDEIERIERTQTVVLTNDQAAYLDRKFTAEDTGDRAAFHKAVTKLKRALGEDAKGAHEKAEAAQQLLEAAFRHYLAEWPDPNLSASIENYPTFRAILDKIQETGLHERREAWAKRLTNWSGQDLVPLAGAFSMAIDDIRERLEPVNDILGKLPFGARGARLRIELTAPRRADIAKFKKDLSDLSRINTNSYSADEVQAWYARLRRFMNDIRDTPGNSRRDYFLNVNDHIEITAVSFDENGPIATYATLGGKSGGESQELVAFIVGAALRFQLGDEANVRPSFAPVLIDEGFVKADGEFTGRSVEAWKGLGFQLIIGAPYDKFTSLEPHADLILHMEKDDKGHSSVTPLTPADAPETATIPDVRRPS